MDFTANGGGNQADLLARLAQLEAENARLKAIGSDAGDATSSSNGRAGAASEFDPFGDMGAPAQAQAQAQSTQVPSQENTETDNFDPFAVFKEEGGELDIRDDGEDAQEEEDVEEEGESSSESDGQEKTQRSPSFSSADAEAERRETKKVTGMYEVRIRKGESGIAFKMDSSKIVVARVPLGSFVDEANEDMAISEGDAIIALNGEAVTSLSLEDFKKKYEESAQASHKLKFRTDTQFKRDPADFFGGGSGSFGDDEPLDKERSRLYEPPDHMDMVYGYIQRFRGPKMISFHLRRESDGKFVMACSVRRDGKGPFIFHMCKHVKDKGTLDKVPQTKGSNDYMGVMVQNLWGTEFVIHDYRVPARINKRRAPTHELGMVLYEKNILGRVPNSLKGALPRFDGMHISNSKQRHTISERLKKKKKKRADIDKSTLQRLTSREKEYQSVDTIEQEELLFFDTKKPSWNEKLQAWTLNFNGRVKIASKKNFLMVPQYNNDAMDEEFGSDTVCLRFGKVLKDKFSLDYRHPISPIQAMGLCLSTFANKLIVT